MDKFQQSFIPKKVFFPAGSRAHSGPVIDILFLAGELIFALSLAFAVFVFIYQNILASQISKMSSDLTAKKNSLELSFIKESAFLDKRIMAIKELLNVHLVPTEIFGLLERKTLASVRFSEFSYTNDSQGQVNISMKGEAKNFNAVALQSDVFGSEDFLINPIISDFDLDDSGNVSFSFKAGVKKDLIDYKRQFLSTTGASTTPTDFLNDGFLPVDDQNVQNIDDLEL